MDPVNEKLNTEVLTSRTPGHAFAGDKQTARGHTICIRPALKSDRKAKNKTHKYILQYTGKKLFVVSMFSSYGRK